MKAVPAWTYTTGTAGVKVLVMDSGVQMNHPALPRVTGNDFTNTPGNPIGSPNGSHFTDAHGTLVSSVLAGVVNNIGIGVAPSVTILSARIGENYRTIPGTQNATFDTNSSWFVSAIYWAESQGARITNNSNTLPTSFSSVSVAYTDTRGNLQLTSLSSTYSTTREADMVHFAATGNNRSGTITYPSSAPGVNAVGGVQANATLWDDGDFGSNWGIGIDFVGPAKDVFVADRTGADGVVSGDYTIQRGTSLASPMVAGVAALLLTQNPSWTATAVEMRMQETARRLGSVDANGYDAVYFGWGMPDAEAALKNSGSAAFWQMFNQSTRAQVSTGTQNLILGFVIAGSQNKTLLIRGVGGTLSQFGVSGVLANPNMTLYTSGGSTVAINDNWNGASNANDIRTTAGLVGAFPLPENSTDAAMLMSLAPGGYTAVIDGVSGTSGVALAELYDTTDKALSSRLANMSCRAYVGTGSSVLIPGLVIQGNAPKSVLIRGVGPTLANFGVPNPISDPQLRVVRSDGVTIVTNDNWNAAPNANIIRSFASTVGAFPLIENSNDAAVLIDLAPATYTVVVDGVNGSTGVGLVEVYNSQ